jgi:hypothetical protein
VVKIISSNLVLCWYALKNVYWICMYYCIKSNPVRKLKIHIYGCVVKFISSHLVLCWYALKNVYLICIACIKSYPVRKLKLYWMESSELMEWGDVNMDCFMTCTMYANYGSLPLMGSSNIGKKNEIRLNVVE